MNEWSSVVSGSVAECTPRHGVDSHDSTAILATNSFAYDNGGRGRILAATDSIYN